MPAGVPEAASAGQPFEPRQRAVEPPVNLDGSGRTPRDAAPPRLTWAALPLAEATVAKLAPYPQTPSSNFSLPSLRLCCVFLSRRSLPVSSRSAYPAGAITAPHRTSISASFGASPSPSLLPFILLLSTRSCGSKFGSDIFWSIPICFGHDRIAAQPTQQSDTALAGPRAAPSARSLPTFHCRLRDHRSQSIDSNYNSLRRGKPWCTLVFSIDIQLQSLNLTRPITHEDAQRSRTHRDSKTKVCEPQPATA